MKAFTRYIEGKTSALLTLLAARASGRVSTKESIEFVETVLSDFSEQFINADLLPPDDNERNFWSTLYQLEEVTEVSMNLALEPEYSDSIRPYLNLAEANLTELQYILQCKLSQSKFFATRPGEYDEANIDIELEMST